MAEMTVPKQKLQRQVENAQKIWLELFQRNWLELPSDVTTNILYRIGVVDILENAQKVCTTWRKICKDPSMWRVIHMKKTISGRCAKMHEMCKHAVDRSQGQLVEINIVDFDRDYELLQYVADKSSQLKRLKVVSGYRRIQWNRSQALKKFLMLEELNLYKIDISKEAIQTVGRCCPMLRTLKLNQQTCMYWHGGTNHKSLMIRNRTAKAIGENLPELRHLELIANNMTNIGLQAILDGCRYLESLDLRECIYISLREICLENIKCIKLPGDTLEACLYLYGSDCMTCGYPTRYGLISRRLGSR